MTCGLVGGPLNNPSGSSESRLGEVQSERTSPEKKTLIPKREGRTVTGRLNGLSREEMSLIRKWSQMEPKGPSC